MLKRWLGLAALVIVLDQLSKAAINSHFVFGESVAVTSFFNLVLAHNTGAAFSFLSDAGGAQRWLFSAIAVVASVWIVWLLRRHQAQKLFSFALAFILGGALGNILDRVRVGHVIDYADFHIGTWRPFLIFNLADALISVGVVIILARSLLIREKPELDSAAEPATEN